MATIKLNGVDQPLSPITGTDLNDKLTVDGESLDSILATLGKGKDLVEITNGSTDSPAFTQVDNNITVNGGDGDDTFQAIDGLVTLTGKLNGVAGDDDIHITSAKGATVQGGLNKDTVTAGTVADLNVAGSNANAAISDSSILGGDGADTVSTLNSAELTDSTVVGGGGHDTMSINGSLDGTSEIVQTTDGAGNTVISSASFIKGGDGRDDITLVNGASIVNTLVSGNANADTISAGANGRGSLADSTGSLISGGAGDDIVEVALAGAMTVKGGSGDDTLRVGSGQTVNGGLGVDTFSIEGKGGATIEDFDAMTQNCFCSDVIQVDGNKLFYDTYEYKSTKELYTSASSWAGDIYVKAVAAKTSCSVNAAITQNASKIRGIQATAVAAFKATETVNFSAANFQPASYPKSGSYRTNLAGVGDALVQFNTNGNTPRPDADVASNGFGYGKVTGFITAVNQTANGVANQVIKLPEHTVYTKKAFTTGTFSFVGLTKVTDNACPTLKQTLTFNKVLQATITNHWASFGISKKVNTETLYQLKFGTTNFTTVMTGKANLIVGGSKLEEKTYVPTQNEMTDPNLLVDYPNLTRTLKVTQNAQVTLNLEGSFRLWTASKNLTKNDGGWNPISTTLGATGVSLSTLQSRGLLTVTAAAAANGVFVHPKSEFARNMNITGSGNAELVTFNQAIVGQTGGVVDTITAQNALYAKISVNASVVADANNGSLAFWRKDATIYSQSIPVTANCSFPSTLNAGVIADPNSKGANNNGKYTPASDGAFVSNYMWDLDGNGLTIGNYGSPSKSNGCLTANGAGATSCSTNGRGDANDNIAVQNATNEVYADAAAVFAKLNANGANSSSNVGAFSGSSFNTTVLAAGGMGAALSSDQKSAQGAPFRILFFDTKTEDNGLYMISGTANYNNNVVTGVETSPTASSAMGTKQTIVKVTGGKGYEIALSDINFV